MPDDNGLVPSEIQILQALFVCHPCIDGKHEECEAPCACALHPPSGKYRPGYIHTFTQEQKDQIKQHMKKGKP